MDVVILGCGRVGARVANVLSNSHAVTVVDWNSSSFDRLRPDFAGQTILGNGIDADVLRSAGIEHADLFLALTDVDNRNLMAAEVANQLGVPRSIARVYDPERSLVFAELGITTVSPTITGARRLFEMVVGREEEA